MIFQTFGLGHTNWAGKFWCTWGIFGKAISPIWHYESLVHGKMDLVVLVFRPNTYHKVASSNTSRLEVHAGFFRLLMKGIFDPYDLLTKS